MLRYIFIASFRLRKLLVRRLASQCVVGRQTSCAKDQTTLRVDLRSSAANQASLARCYLFVLFVGLFLSSSLAHSFPGATNILYDASSRAHLNSSSLRRGQQQTFRRRLASKTSCERKPSSVSVSQSASQASSSRAS